MRPALLVPLGPVTTVKQNKNSQDDGQHPTPPPHTHILYELHNLILRTVFSFLLKLSSFIPFSSLAAPHRRTFMLSNYCVCLDRQSVNGRVLAVRLQTVLTDVLLVPTAVMAAWWWRKRPITCRAEAMSMRGRNHRAVGPPHQV